MRERFLLLASTLDYQDFDSFVRAKALWHEELAEIKDSTLQRLRSNVFKMLREAELLSKAGEHHARRAVRAGRCRAQRPLAE